MAEISGFLNIDKPLRMTSHDVVGKIRRGLRLKKVGHAGTLDPLATGVLVICIGNATRLSEYVMQTTKRYRARVHLGVVTDTYDAEGIILQQRDATLIQKTDLARVLPQFVGEIQQLPPMYSAIKQDGRKLYDLARAGEVVERELRTVYIDSLEVSDWSLPEFTLDISCSAGTYIRSLAFDIGEVLGVGAHLSGLVRMSSGVFKLEDAVQLDALLTDQTWQHQLVSPASALASWQSIQLSGEEANHIVHGRSIPQYKRADGMVFAYHPEGHLLAILRADSGLWRPHKVFSE